MNDKHKALIEARDNVYSLYTQWQMAGSETQDYAEGLSCALREIDKLVRKYRT